MKEHHGVKVWDDIGDFVGGLGGEEGDYAERWEGLERVVAFEDEGEVG